MRERKLLETNIFQEDMEQEEVHSLVEWCEHNCTFVHMDEMEFMFWIPPFDGHEIILKGVYGESIPALIKDALIQAVHSRATESDAGYLLVAVI